MRKACFRTSFDSGNRCLFQPFSYFATLLLYAQAPYFMLGYRKKFGKKALKEFQTTMKKKVLNLHKDVGFEEMTDHKILSRDGATQMSVFEDGLEVEVDRTAGTYRISAGRARTKGTERIIKNKKKK